MVRERFQIGNAPPGIEHLPLRKMDARFDLAGFGNDSRFESRKLVHLDVWCFIDTPLPDQRIGEHRMRPSPKRRGDIWALQNSATQCFRFHERRLGGANCRLADARFDHEALGPARLSKFDRVL